MGTSTNKLMSYCAQLGAPINPRDAGAAEKKLVLRPWQRRMLSAKCRWQYNVFSTPRQMGCTTALIAWCIWSADQYAQRVLYISHNKNAAAHATEQARHMLRPVGCRRATRDSIGFASGGTINFSSCRTEEAGEAPYDCIAVDNAAFFPRTAETVRSMRRLLSERGRLSVASCHNLQPSSEFAALCLDADVGMNDFMHMRVSLRDAWCGDDASLAAFAKNGLLALGERDFRIELGNYPF